MKRALQFALGVLVALVVQGLAVAQSATVMTDKADYAPGTIVTITGSGWQPGETVTLSFVESPLIDSHPDLYATADANGNIFNNQFSPDSYDADITFTLTGTGGSSGLQAQTSFTDQAKLTNNGVSVGSQSPASISPGGTATYNLTIGFNGSGSCTVALTVVTALPTGASALFSPSTITSTGSNQTSTLTISTTGATPGGTTSFTVRAQGTGGAGNDCTSAETVTAAGSLVVSSPSVRRKGQTIVASLFASERYTVVALQRSGI